MNREAGAAPPPPELDERLLDEAQLESLVGEIEAVAQGLELRLKAADTARSHPDAMPLREAVQALRGGSLVGLQLRYELGDPGPDRMLRWDVLMRTPEGTKLVRVESNLQRALARRGGTQE